MNCRIPITLFCSISLLLITLLVSSCDRFDQVNLPNDFFVKFYGEEGNQEGVDLLVNESDKSLIILGTTYLGTESRLYLIKTDWFGNVIWKKKLGGTNDIAKDIEFSNDGGFIILCQSRGLNGDIADTKLLKVSSDGVKTDSAVFGFTRVGGSSANEYPEKVTALSDGYIVMGTTDFDSTSVTVLNLYDYLHVKFDESLTARSDFKQWSSQASKDYGVKAIQLNAGNIYVFVSSSNITEKPGAIDNDLNFWFHGLNSTGEITTGKSGHFGTDAPGLGESLPITDERLVAVCPAFSPGYFLVGTYTTGPTVSDIFYGQVYEDGSNLVATQTTGRLIIPNRKVAPVAVCQSFREGDMGYLILANEGDEGTGNIWLTKVNDQGGELWSYSFGAQGSNNDFAGAVAELPDRSIIVVGTVNIGDENELKISLFKLNGYGRLAN